MVAAFHKRGCKRNRKAGRIVNQAHTSSPFLNARGSILLEANGSKRRGAPVGRLAFPAKESYKFRNGLVTCTKNEGVTFIARKGVKWDSGLIPGVMAAAACAPTRVERL